MGEFNVNKTTGGLNQTAGMPETYPAEQVMMSDGTTSVEEAVNEKGVVFYTSEYNVTVIAQRHGSDVQIHFTPTGIDYYLNDQKIWTISKNS